MCNCLNHKAGHNRNFIHKYENLYEYKKVQKKTTKVYKVAKHFKRGTENTFDASPNI